MSEYKEVIDKWLLEFPAINGSADETKPCGCSAKYPYFYPQDRMFQIIKCAGCCRSFNWLDDELYKLVKEKCEIGIYKIVDFIDFEKWIEENKSDGEKLIDAIQEAKEYELVELTSSSKKSSQG